MVQYGLVEAEAVGPNNPIRGGEVEMEDRTREDVVVENTPDQKRKRKVEQLEWMECPVCLETPSRNTERHSGQLQISRFGMFVRGSCHQPMTTRTVVCSDQSGERPRTGERVTGPGL